MTGLRGKFSAPPRRLGCLALAAALFAATASLGAISVLDTYYSPRNRERPARGSTRFIILHTTEGRSRGAGAKLSRRGEAHYMIDEVGRIYRIIDQRRVAYHCGRSMWNGRTSLDNCSIGIEMAGYHNRDLTAAQYRALKDLLTEIQAIYGVPDERVLCHSMVAYGAPNQWQRRSHRGRKRCGMRFAMTSVRARLGLTAKPARDPDVTAKRLVVADPYLHRVLYSGSATEQAQAAAKYLAKETNVIGPGRSAWDIARDEYNSADTVYVLPDGTRKNGTEIVNWRAIPRGTKVLLSEGDANPPEQVRTLGTTGATPASVAGDESLSATTIYVLPDGRCLRGNTLTAEIIAAMPTGTRVLVGYKMDGPITSRRRAFDICGPCWQEADTFYLFPGGTLMSGNTVDAGRIPRGTMVLFKN
ncbi:MAG: N-acetylmuramoyl-L-alanine amidase [Kiritimatiellae bacterium]|nr:N-acetylmuramoyl-L-alanine amidase [Kiritimatiellia bacterium]